MTPTGASNPSSHVSAKGQISSTAARAGHTDQMTVAAAQFDAETGAWTDPARYQRWQVSGT